MVGWLGGWVAGWLGRSRFGQGVRGVCELSQGLSVEGMTEWPLLLAWRSVSSSLSLLQGSIGFPGFPSANGEKGGRVRTVLARCAACVRVPVLALHSVSRSFFSIC